MGVFSSLHPQDEDCDLYGGHQKVVAPRMDPGLEDLLSIFSLPLEETGVLRVPPIEGPPQSLLTEVFPPAGRPNPWLGLLWDLIFPEFLSLRFSLSLHWALSARAKRNSPSPAFSFHQCPQGSSKVCKNQKYHQGSWLKR